MTNYIFGHIEGQPIHSIYPKRKQCHDAKIHVNLQKGIGAGGASIVLSGGYEDVKNLVGCEVFLLIRRVLNLFYIDTRTYRILYFLTAI